MKNFDIIIGADVRGYHYFSVEAKSRKDAREKALAELDKSGYGWNWETEDVQGEVSIQIGTGEFVDVPDHIAKDYHTLEAEVAKWRPMDSAPLDGTHCILSVPSPGGFIYSVQGAFQNGQWNAVHCDNVKPLAWMPNVLLPQELRPAEASALAPAKGGAA